MVNALQLLSAINRLVAMAHGTTGRPDNFARVTIPSPAFRAGPGAKSAVIATVVPFCIALSAPRSAAAPPRSLRLPPAPAPLISHMPKRFSTAPISSASP